MGNTMSVRLTVVVAVLAFCACQSGAETITAEEAAAGVYTDGHRLGEAVYGSGATFASGAFASGKVAIPNMIPKVHIREINVKQKKTLQQAKVKAIKAKEAALKAKAAARKKLKESKAKLAAKKMEGKAKVEKAKQKALEKGRKLAAQQKDRLRRRKQKEG